MQLVAVKISIAALLVALVTSCAQPPDLAASREQLLALTAQYAPQVKTLNQKFVSLAGRVAVLPPNLPDTDAVTTMLARHQVSAAALQGRIDKLPAETAAAVQTGKAADVDAVSARTIEAIGGGVLQLSDEAIRAELAVAALESQARAAAAAAAATTAVVPPVVPTTLPANTR